MQDFLDDWGLVLVTFIPVLGAIVMMGISKTQEMLLKQVALVTSLAAAVFGILIAANFDYDNAGELQFLVDKSWIEVISSRFIFGLDGMSLPLMLLTLLVVTAVQGLVYALWFAGIATTYYDVDGPNNLRPDARTTAANP